MKIRKTQSVTIRLSEAEAKGIDDSLEDEMDRSKFIRFAIQAALDRKDRPRRFGL